MQLAMCRVHCTCMTAWWCWWQCFYLGGAIFARQNTIMQICILSEIPNWLQEIEKNSQHRIRQNIEMCMRHILFWKNGLFKIDSSILIGNRFTFIFDACVRIEAVNPAEIDHGHYVDQMHYIYHKLQIICNFHNSQPASRYCDGNSIQFNAPHLWANPFISVKIQLHIQCVYLRQLATRKQ